MVLLKTKVRNNELELGNKEGVFNYKTLMEMF